MEKQDSFRRNGVTDATNEKEIKVDNVEMEVRITQK